MRAASVDGIFISYRRDDSAGYAGRLYDRLAGHFGPGRVFMDVEGIEPGTDFVDAIENAVASCRVLIVLIGDEWLSTTDASGRRRLDDPHDFIRLETRAALARDIRVVPVLLDRAPMPAYEALPEDLRPLVRRQAVELNHKQWEATSGELIRTLEKILDTSDAPAPPAEPEP
ncbi:toll/interleukin-1 receptor domain-containing protein, partial [Denitromonas sp.]|uniref:toll/interleukin-1 receptor domain-containing protein n=1 Tax=Denitromonas sp. TaxID=2734609 RepID=UPI002FDE8806